MADPDGTPNIAEALRLVLDLQAELRAMQADAELEEAFYAADAAAQVHITTWFEFIARLQSLDGLAEEIGEALVGD